MSDDIIINCIEKGIIWGGWSESQKQIMQEAINRTRELQHYKSSGLTATEVSSLAKAQTPTNE